MKSIDDYINEMKKLSVKAAVPVAEKTITQTLSPSEPKRPSLNNTGMGELTVVVNSAFDRPLSGAAVSVYDSVTNDFVTTEYTDESGKTKVIYLPAPEKSESMAPSENLVYGLYDIEVTKDGYIGAVMREIPVFDGTSSIQQISLLLVAASNGDVEQSESQGDPFNL